MVDTHWDNNPQLFTIARLDPCGTSVAESRIASAINESKGLLRGFENYSYNSKHNDYI